MDGRIGHLHCHFRIMGAAAGGEPARLERVARERLPDAWADALARALGDDPTVYVLRRVESALTIRDDGTLTDGALAERWGARLAGAIVRRIAEGAGDPDVIRFEDQADFVAHFLADLLRGVAWDRWYYGAFAAWRDRPRQAVLRAALLDERERLPAVLRRLHAVGSLDALLRTVDPETLRELWLDGAGSRTLDLAAARPVWSLALRLIDRLELWAGARPGDEAFAALLAVEPLPADWRDGRGPAAAIRDVLRFLAERGYIRCSQDGSEAAFSDRLDAALLKLDWADTSWLRAAILELLHDTARPAPAAALPARPRGGPTPKQRDLLADILAVLQAGAVWLDAAAPESAANGLRLHTALVAHAARWDGDPAAPAMIRHLLAVWAALRAAREPETVLRLLRAGDPQAAALHLAAGRTDAAASALATLTGLGEPAMAVVDRLLREHGDAGTPTAGFESGAAGLFLLLRAVLDLRLPWLLRQTAYPGADPPAGPSAVLVELGRRLSGVGEPKDGDSLDAGLRLFAGLDLPFARAEHQALWSVCDGTDDRRFQEALFAALVRQHLAGGPELHVYALDLARGSQALVAGEAGVGLWPFGKAIDEADDAAPAIAAWLEAWERSTGRRPEVILGEELAREAAALARSTGARVVVVPAPAADATTAASTDDPADRHRAGEEALRAALAALGRGDAGRANADLTLDLAALALLRLWSRWLRQFAGSTAPYLLRTFVQRSGWIAVDPETIVVELDPGPLDVVLELAGYLEDLERVSWLGERRLRFRR